MVYLHERGEKATRKSSYFEAAGQRTKTCWTNGPRRRRCENLLATQRRCVQRFSPPTARHNDIHCETFIAHARARKEVGVVKKFEKKCDFTLVRLKGLIGIICR